MPKSYLIRQATILQKGHSLHEKKVDVLLTNGFIEQIGQNLKADAIEIRGKNLWLTAGWVDMRCHLSDPGNEHKDSLINMLDTAASGGFTGILTLPHSVPEISDKSGVNYLRRASNDHLVDLHISGVLSDVKQPENLAELYDMHLAGAVAFTNGDQSVSNGLLKKALLYTKSFGARVVTHPSDKSIEQGGCVNESENTIHTGLKTSPALAEYVSVREQIEVARYCGAAVHFSCISAAESVQLIHQAKKEGLPITCDVSIFNLCFTDEEVLGFDENFKLYPPLRSEKDKKALIDGVNDGTIDAICSNHHPQNIESKQVEFDYADTGALSLQLMLPWYIKYLSATMQKTTFIAAVTSGPRSILGLSQVSLQEKSAANLTVIDIDEVWTLDKNTNQSASKNTHEWGLVQKGRVVATFNKNNVKLT